MKISRIKETCIYVSNLESSRQFYESVLGLPVISIVAGRHIFFRAGDSVLLCFIAEETKKKMELPSHGAIGTIHFAFEVDKKNYTLAMRKVKDAGIQILKEHTWKGKLKSFYFHDPDKNLVEIIEEGLWD